jgi:hypothetical protein
VFDTHHPGAEEAGFGTGDIYLATERSVVVLSHPNESNGA